MANKDRTKGICRHGGGRHRLEHPRSVHDPGEGAGGQQDRGHQQGRFCVRVDARALVGDLWIVDQESQGEADHEDDGRCDQPGDQHAHDHERQQEIDREQPGSPEG